MTAGAGSTKWGWLDQSVWSSTSTPAGITLPGAGLKALRSDGAGTRQAQWKWSRKEGLWLWRNCVLTPTLAWTHQGLSLYPFLHTLTSILMGPGASLRALEADERRRQRDAQRQQRELERRKKEQAKLSAIEQARLEVETYENRLEVLLSVHKEQGPTWDWTALAAALPPPCPQDSLS